MANDQSLEDFASGIGTGAFRPQQGSGLPVSAQGGLPLGSAPMVPPAAPPHTPPFQVPPQQGRPPMPPLGGPVPDYEQMIAKRVQAMQRFDPNRSSFEDRRSYGMGMEQLDSLRQLQAQRAKGEESKAGHLKEIGTQLKAFSSLTIDEQTNQRPIMEKLLSAYSQLAGMQLGPNDIKDTLSSPNLAAQYADVLGGDELIDTKAALSRLGSVQAGKARQDELGMVLGDAGTRAGTMVQQYLPQAIAQFGGSTKTPLAMDEFVAKLQADPELGKALKGSRSLRTALSTYVSDSKNAETLAGLGLIPGKVNLESMLAKGKAQAEGPKMTAIGGSFLASMFTGADGKPLTPVNANSAQIGAALEAEKAFEIKKHAESGLTTAKYMLQMPAAAEERDKHVDVGEFMRTGQITKPSPGISVGALRTGDYRYASPAQLEKLTALAPARTQLDTFQGISDRLIMAKTPAEAFEQGVKLTAGAYTGSNALAKAYTDSSEGFIGGLARALGGERGTLTDLDRQVMRKAANASFFDTQASKDIKKAIINDIYVATHGSVASEITGKAAKAQTSQVQDLLRKLDAATNDGLVTSAKAYMKTHPGEIVVRDPEKGTMGVIRKGQSMPKGWKAVE